MATVRERTIFPVKQTAGPLADARGSDYTETLKMFLMSRAAKNVAQRRLTGVHFLPPGGHHGNSGLPLYSSTGTARFQSVRIQILDRREADVPEPHNPNNQ